MAKHSHAGLIGGAAPYAFLLGVLVFPTTVVSQQPDTNNDGRFTAPVQSQLNQYGEKAYGSRPSGNFASPAGAGFGDHMPLQGYGSGYGAASEYGASPFDKADMPPQQLPWGNAGSGSSGSSALPMQMPPRFGMGTAMPPFPQQNGPSGYGTMGQGNAANMPYPGQGGRFCSQGGFPGCAGNPFMGHHGGMGMGAGIRRIFQIPDLSDAQRGKIQDILDELRRAHWKSMGEEMEYSTQLRRLYAAEPLDAKAIGEAYAKIFDIKRKMIEGGIEAEKKAMDVLTDEQRKLLRSWKG